MPFGRGGLVVSDGWCNAPPMSSGRNPFRSAAAWRRRLRCTSLPLLSPPRGARRGPLFCDYMGSPQNRRFCGERKKEWSGWSFRRQPETEQSEISSDAMRRARWKRENEGRGRAASGSRHVSSPRRSAGGGFGSRRIDFLLFPLPLTWRWIRLGSLAGSFSGSAPPGGVVGDADQIVGGNMKVLCQNYQLVNGGTAPAA